MTEPTATCPQAQQHHPRRACPACGLCADGARPDAGLRYDRRTGRAWLCFPTRAGEEEVAALKAAGWRWSGYRGEWHHPRKHVEPPAPVRFRAEGFCDYSDERGERLAERAERVAGQAEAVRARVDRITACIPLGQPILVGHHSEARSRRDAARIHDGSRQAYELGQAARDLAARAASSERLHARQDSYGGLVNRAERLGAEVRKMERVLAGRPAGPEGETEWWADYVRRLGLLRAELAGVEADRDALQPANDVPGTVKVGDLIRFQGRFLRVDRVNAKTFSTTQIGGGNLDGWKAKVPKHLVEKNLGPWEEMRARIETKQAGG
jgi:hypothetical protein